MSHIVKVKTTIKNNECLRLACTQVGASAPEEGTCTIYGTTYTGVYFKLPGWRYPVCISNNGVLNFDNYQGSWGDKRVLDELLQRYTTNVSVRNLVRTQGARMQGQPTMVNGKLRTVMVIP